jgi:hypothetical protein
MSLKALSPEFAEAANIIIMDSIFNLTDDDMKWRMWVVSTSTRNEWPVIAQNLMDDGYDMETWLAAAYSYREALAGNIEWVVI